MNPRVDLRAPAGRGRPARPTSSTPRTRRTSSPRSRSRRGGRSAAPSPRASPPRRPADVEGSAAGAGPSGAQAPVVQRSRSNKRKRSIQRRLNQQVIEEAEHEARLEESQLEDDFNTPEATILSNRRTNLDLQEEMDSKRRRVILTKIENNTKATLERFDFAKTSLNTSAAAKIKSVEDSYARRQLEQEKERRVIEKEEKDLQDTLNKSKTDYAIFHASDNAALENLIAAVQAPETEDSHDQDSHDQDTDEEEEEDQDQEDEDDE